MQLCFKSLRISAAIGYLRNKYKHTAIPITVVLATAAETTTRLTHKRYESISGGLVLGTADECDQRIVVGPSANAGRAPNLGFVFARRGVCAVKSVAQRRQLCIFFDCK